MSAKVWSPVTEAMLVADGEDVPRLSAVVERQRRAIAQVRADRETDVVLTDHDRPELGPVLESFLRLPARWIGVMGSPRHSAPHIDALRQLGVPDQVIARVRLPIGLNIGSQTPAEIAISTLAGLIADRNRRPGGFQF